ncbi:MAG: chemoreceptor glutamine deamidase CheD [Spirochaetes bacterium]|nr:chemoreceptor glutamine deamidase CheD [Spirochaetota bacterium]
MIRTEASTFGKPLYILNPGDHFATAEDCVLATIAGSCIVVCLFDIVRGIGGMGHFIVPGSVNTVGIYSDAIAQHGILNLEYLIGELVKLGGDRRFLRAKIFGAGYIAGVPYVENATIDSNIRFMFEYFTLERIAVERSDLGGEFRRKLYFFPKTGYVYRKVLRHNENESEFIRLEKEYIDRTFRNKEFQGKVMLFE